MPNPKTQIVVGRTYRDIITNFEGVCIAIYLYLSGCVRIELEGREIVDGKIKEYIFDEQRLVPVNTEAAKAISQQLPEPVATGGYRPTPRRTGH